MEDCLKYILVFQVFISVGTAEEISWPKRSAGPLKEILASEKRYVISLEDTIYVCSCNLFHL